MNTIAICDDDTRVAKEVAKLIKEWNPRIQVACFTSGEEMLENYYPFQGIFLDIDMEGMDGIETGRRIRQMDKETKIVYLTAYRDYVAGAFGVHAFQYLIKPVKKTVLWNVLEEIFRYTRRSRKQIVLDFHTANGIVCLNVDSICYFEYINRRIRIVTEQEEYYMVDKIGSVLERMKGFGFSMPHQSFVVNMLHVKNVKNQQIYLDNGLEIPLSQKKQKLWKQELAEYLSSRLED